MKKSKHEYVVGFRGDHQAVYGKDYEGKSMFADKLTLFQAKRKAKDLFPSRVPRVIYKLVPVEFI